MEAGGGPGPGPAAAPGNNNNRGRGGAAAPNRGRDMARPPRKDSEGYSESPDLEFEYADTDKWAAELSELYSYTEGPEFLLNRKCFEEDFRIHMPERRWPELERAQHRTHAMRLLDGLEVTARERRLRVARAILYVAQGTFGECSSEAEVQAWMRYNIFLLLEVGTFNALVELLNMEIDNSAACSSAVRKPAISLADSTDLRVLLNIMYLIVETVRQEAEGDKPEWKSMRQTFRAELGAPLYNNEPFSVMLFGMVTKFCSGHAPHFPMKKVLLLLWKTVLCTLGGFEELQSMKAEKREILGLPPLPEDSIQVIRNMRAASPPASASDLIEQQQKRGRREHKALIKQDNLDAFNERDPYKADDSREEEEENDDDNSLEGETFPLERDEVMPPPTQHPPSERITCPKGLPWAPKVREKDIEMFLESSRSKFIGYTLGSDTNTVVGLPRPIHESIRTLKLVSPSRDSHSPFPSPCSQHSSGGVFLSHLPHSSAPWWEQPEVLIPSLLSQAVQAPSLGGCIPSFFLSRGHDPPSPSCSISVLDYPYCVVHELPELTAESLEAGDNNQFCWRNLFSCINLLRILNKLTKWKHSRTMMLVVFKSAPILKRALKVKQAMLQLYVLKLLKVQTKYLGRQWRKSNMKTMSAIYQKVRHRLNDDWAYGNDLDARPWDFQAEECALRASIERFNARRYDRAHGNPEFVPVDNCLQSVLGQRVELPEDFQVNYDLWLEREVFSRPISWEELLQ
ncbi:striatin-interacting protein 1 [Neopelma chrysocephalum]|uniref:striatin-interacting protein 1 n=1 Tax=Neopelma chrysocephalum TaxID=114329 RepID=UPI000FCD49E0|nr:striatin-interacting protein 1 [Neopelma chrysocephalum]